MNLECLYIGKNANIGMNFLKSSLPTCILCSENIQKGKQENIHV